MRLGLQSGGTPHLSQEEREVAQAFVHEKHVRAIAIAAKVGKFAVTFRASGDLTLQCIASGAPCKGHDLLEKTVKGSSLAKVYGHAGPRLLAAMRAVGVAGRVGHWSGDRLLGLYVSAEARAFATSHDPARRALATRLLQTPDHRHDYYPIDTDDLEASLTTLKAVAGWETLAPSGDYDMHDMINFEGRRGPVPSASDQERHIIDAINSAVAAADESRPLDQPHLHVVQHGPQYNYPAYTMGNEPGQPLIGAVARPEFPLALCDRGDWRILTTFEALKAFYDDHRIPMKITWAADSSQTSGRDTLHFADHPDGHAFLSRRSSASDGAAPSDSPREVDV